MESTHTDLSWAVELIIALLLPTLGVIGAFLARYTGKLLKVSETSQTQQRLDSAYANAANAVVEWASREGQNLKDVNVRSSMVVNGLGYMRDNIGPLLADKGITDKEIANRVAAELNKLAPIDPTVQNTPTVIVQQPVPMAPLPAVNAPPAA